MAGIPRLFLVAALTFRATFSGLRTFAFVALALIPSLIVLAILAGGASSGSAASIAQTLFLTLTVRVVLLLTVLVVFVAPFRSEIELDTLTYLTTRSIPRALVAVGKYFGAVAASLALLLPASFLPTALAGLAGAPAPDATVLWAILDVTLLAVLAYGGFFLLLGLVSRSALVIGLIYGFLWEELILLLPGEFPRLTVLYYLLSVADLVAPNGAFATPLPPFPLGVAVAAPLLTAAVFLALTAFLVRNVETAPQRVSA